MVAPHVAGAAALLISKLEQFTTSEITEAKLFTALSHNTNDLGKLKILKLK